MTILIALYLFIGAVLYGIAWAKDDEIFQNFFLSLFWPYIIIALITAKLIVKK